MREDYTTTFDPLLLLPEGLLVSPEPIPEAFRACFRGYQQATDVVEGTYPSIALFHSTGPLLRKAQDHLTPGGYLLVHCPEKSKVKPTMDTLAAEGYLVRDCLGRLEAPGFSYALYPLGDRRMLRFLLSISRSGLRKWRDLLLVTFLPTARYAKGFFVLAEKA